MTPNYSPELGHYRTPEALLDAIRAVPSADCVWFKRALGLVGSLIAGRPKLAQLLCSELYYCQREDRPTREALRTAIGALHGC